MFQFQDNVEGIGGSQNLKGMPSVLQKIIIEPKDGATTIHEQIRYKMCKLVPGQGISFFKQADSFEMNIRVAFGDHLMSVLQKLGNPNKEFYQNKKLCLNYLELGVDIIFEHHELVVTKFVAHLNSPLMSDFWFYDRADCVISLEKESSNAELAVSGKPDKDL